MRRHLEKEYGKKQAAQLLKSDPTKDLVRQQSSRFQSVVDEERKAKRHRDLAELEARDEMSAKMEALTSITVTAWKCAECDIVSDSHRGRVVCEQKGHAIQHVQVKRTRWECKCSFSLNVLDKRLPSHCPKCNAMCWRPVPLQRVARAPMERELLLPRGEELPFLNSIPNMPKCRMFKEASDDYDGFSTDPGAVAAA